MVACAFESELSREGAAPALSGGSTTRLSGNQIGRGAERSHSAVTFP